MAEKERTEIFVKINMSHGPAMSSPHMTRMPPDVVIAHDVLGRELSLLYEKWNQYKVLFCTDDESVELLEYAAQFFFRLVDEVLRDDIIMSVCRITDPPKSCGNDNLTIKQLASMIPSQDNVLQLTLGSMLSTMDKRCSVFREHRNRRIGHSDLNIRLKCSNTLLPGIGINATEAALKCIADALNAIENHYDNNERSYDQGVYGSGHARDLLDFIRREQNLEQYHEEKEYGDSATEPDTRPTHNTIIKACFVLLPIVLFVIWWWRVG